jgi:hypothetical protein
MVEKSRNDLQMDFCGYTRSSQQQGVVEVAARVDASEAQVSGSIICMHGLS